ncbi:copper resistance CopC/CopD family protein [Streptomyces tateyamensis]|uniref:copper resistance CopC/CopD family protein n=1 Tax=Streptomyces tateyamensis TaxID=565073 RepID=UPI001FEBF99B|nr:copper resistance protein CopC [Streptomyces tateyamensis]
MRKAQSLGRAVRLVGLLLGLLLAVLALVLGAAGPAAAHAVLVRASPADGAVLAGAPPQVRLVFSEALAPGLGTVRVIGPEGRRADTGGPPVAQGDALLVGLDAGRQQGTFVVEWRVTAADDGHTTAGAVAFSVGAPSRNAALGAPGGGDRTTQALLDLAVWLGFAGLAVMVGSAAVRLWCLPPDAEAPGALAPGWAVLLVGTVLQLFAYGPATQGESLAHLTDRSLLAATLAGHQGHVLVARILLLALAATAGGPLLRRPGPATRAAAAALTLLFALTWAETSHAAAGPLVPLALLATTLHVAAMALWAGGVATLALLAVRGGGAGLPAVARRFSGLATASVAVLAVTGAWQALREVGSTAALTGTPYGRLLLAKLAVLAVVLAAAGLLRGRVSGRVDNRVEAGAAVRRAVLLELAGVTALVVLTVLMIGTAPARTAAPDSQAGAPDSRPAAAVTILTAAVRGPAN